MDDSLPGLDAWPGITADYDVAGDAQGAPVLRLRLAFDGAAFSPDPAGAREDVTAVAGTAEAPAWQLAALRALPAFQQLADELPGSTVAWASSLLPGGEQLLDEAARASLLAWLFGEGGVHAFLQARSEGDAAGTVPPAWTLDAAIARELAAAPVCALSTSITLSCPQASAAPDAPEDAPRDGSVTTLLTPREEGDGFAGFARRIEQALAVPGRCIRKLAASADGSGTRLWLVRLGLADGEPVRLRLAGTDGPWVFAPRPLYATPQSRAAVPFHDYVPGQGIDFARPGGTSALSGIDGEAWLREFLAAVDAAEAPAHAGDLRAARQQLARALSRLLVPVLADQSPSAAQCAAAQEAFRQQALLGGLAAAHAADALAQFAVQADGGDGTGQQHLHGELLPHAGSGAGAALTPASLPLREPGEGAATPLGFLCTASGEDGVKPRAATLDLSFRTRYIQAGALRLFFVLPEDAPPGEGLLDLRLGRFDVPVALRALPEPPSPLVQEAVAHPVQEPAGWAQLAQALKWDLRIAWDSAGDPHDAVHCTVRFNGDDEAVPPIAAAAAGAPDPLPALFDFIHAYPQLRGDLEGKGDPLAQQAFVRLVQHVAQALSAFVSAPPRMAGTAQADAAACVPASQGAVSFAGLDLLAVRSARASLLVERNQGLLPGRRTADAFVLRTAAAGFASPVRPLVRIGEAIDLAAAGGDAPVPRPLAAQLDRALTALFASAPPAPQLLQVEVGYATEIAGAGTVSLPVLLLPPTRFQPKRAVPAAGGEDLRTQDELAGHLAEGVRQWFAARQPERGGTLVFTLTVFADAGPADPPVPLLVLEALSLRFADWNGT